MESQQLLPEHESIAKVLFFSALDEAFALEETRDLTSKIDVTNNENKILFLKELVSKIRKERKKNKSHQAMSFGKINFPVGVDISHWREFKLSSPEESFELVLLKWIGEYSDQDLSEAMGVSPGTLRSRYAKGLEILGKLVIKEHLR